MSSTVGGFFEAVSLHKPAVIMVQAFQENQVIGSVFLSLLLLTIYFVKIRPKFAKKKKTPKLLSPDEAEKLISSFKPDSLCPALNKSAELVLQQPKVVLEGVPDTYVKVKGRSQELLNFATMDFLGFGRSMEVHKAALDALNAYGCGSCGPRGFYGTIDVHVYLEDALTDFFQVDNSIVYSDDSSTVSSIIPAFCNKRDLLVVDDGCNDSVITGCNLSRARVIYFKHNDMDDLERVLKMIEEEDEEKSRNKNRWNKPKPQRRFIVIEGIYANYGDIAPLPQLVELKKRYKWYLAADERLSIGTLGKNGRGLTEHFGFPTMTIELIAASLSTTFASIGGFCIGAEVVVEHQRLSGAGYCFSASSPPFVSTAAIATIKLLESEGEKNIKILRERVEFLHECLQKFCKGVLSTDSSVESPICHIRLAEGYRTVKSKEDSLILDKKYEEEKKLRKIVNICQDQGILVICPVQVLEQNSIGAFPSIKIALTKKHTAREVESAVKVLAQAAKLVLQ